MPRQVELCRRYSNRVELVKPLVSVLGKINYNTMDSENDLPALVSNDPSLWRLSDRLTEEDIDKIVTSGQDGVPMEALAGQFDVSRSSIKRIFAQNGVSIGRGNYKRQ